MSGVTGPTATKMQERTDQGRTTVPEAALDVPDPARRLSELRARAREFESAGLAERLATAEQDAAMARARARELEAALTCRLGELGTLARHCAAYEAREAALRARLEEAKETERRLRQAEMIEAVLRAHLKSSNGTKRRLSQAQQTEATLRARLAETEAMVAQMLSSTSWRLTAPMRRVANRLRAS